MDLPIHIPGKETETQMAKHLVPADPALQSWDPCLLLQDSEAGAQPTASQHLSTLEEAIKEACLGINFFYLDGDVAVYFLRKEDWNQCN